MWFIDERMEGAHGQPQQGRQNQVETKEGAQAAEEVGGKASEGVGGVKSLRTENSRPFGHPCAEKTNSSALFLGFETQDNKL
jgi:hypothetical protein